MMVKLKRLSDGMICRGFYWGGTEDVKHAWMLEHYGHSVEVLGEGTDASLLARSVQDDYLFASYNVPPDCWVVIRPDGWSIGLDEVRFEEQYEIIAMKGE